MNGSIDGGFIAMCLIIIVVGGAVLTKIALEVAISIRDGFRQLFHPRETQQPQPAEETKEPVKPTVAELLDIAERQHKDAVREVDRRDLPSQAKKDFRQALLGDHIVNIYKILNVDPNDET